MADVIGVDVRGTAEVWQVPMNPELQTHIDFCELQTELAGQEED